MYESRENVCNVVRKLNSKGTVVNLYRHCSKCLQGDSLSSYVSLSLLNTHAPFEQKTRQQIPQPGVPPTDDIGGPLGKGVLSATAESNTAVPVGPSRPSSITYPEVLQRLTCSYIDGILAVAIWYATKLSLL